MASLDVLTTPPGLDHVLQKIDSSSSSSFCASLHASSSCGVFASSCRVPISQVATLVESIFTVDMEKLEGDVQYSMEVAQSLAHCLDSCWQSVGSFSSTLNSNCESIDVALGDEAAIMLGDIFTHCIKNLVNEFNNSTSKQLQLWTRQVLQLLKALASNTFTAKFLYSAHSEIDIVSQLTKLFDSIPPVAGGNNDSDENYELLVECVYLLAHHYPLYQQIVGQSAAPTSASTWTLSLTSLFQRIFDRASNNDSNSSNSKAVKKLTEWCSFVYSLHELRSFADEDLLTGGILKDISEVVPLWSASSNKMSMNTAADPNTPNNSWGLPAHTLDIDLPTGGGGGEGEDGTDPDAGSQQDRKRVEAETKRMVEIVGSAVESVNTGIVLMRTVIRGMETVAHTRTHAGTHTGTHTSTHTATHTDTYAMAEMIANNSLFGSLATIAALLSSASELATVIDWTILASTHTHSNSHSTNADDLHTVIDTCICVFAQLLSTVMSALHEHTLLVTVRKHLKQLKLMLTCLHIDSAHTQTPTADTDTHVGDTNSHTNGPATDTQNKINPICRVYCAHTSIVDVLEQYAQMVRVMTAVNTLMHTVHTLKHTQQASKHTTDNAGVDGDDDGEHIHEDGSVSAHTLEADIAALMTAVCAHTPCNSWLCACVHRLCVDELLWVGVCPLLARIATNEMDTDTHNKLLHCLRADMNRYFFDAHASTHASTNTDTHTDTTHTDMSQNTPMIDISTANSALLFLFVLLRGTHTMCAHTSTSTDTHILTNIQQQVIELVATADSEQSMLTADIVELAKHCHHIAHTQTQTQTQTHTYQQLLQQLESKFVSLFTHTPTLSVSAYVNLLSDYVCLLAHEGTHTRGELNCETRCKIVSLVRAVIRLGSVFIHQCDHYFDPNAHTNTHTDIQVDMSEWIVHTQLGYLQLPNTHTTTQVISFALTQFADDDSDERAIYIMELAAQLDNCVHTLTALVRAVMVVCVHTLYEPTDRVRPADTHTDTHTDTHAEVHPMHELFMDVFHMLCAHTHVRGGGVCSSVRADNAVLDANLHTLTSTLFASCVSFLCSMFVCTHTEKATTPAHTHTHNLIQHLCLSVVKSNTHTTARTLAADILMCAFREFTHTDNNTHTSSSAVHTPPFDEDIPLSAHTHRHRRAVARSREHTSHLEHMLLEYGQSTVGIEDEKEELGVIQLMMCLIDCKHTHTRADTRADTHANSLATGLLLCTHILHLSPTLCAHTTRAVTARFTHVMLAQCLFLEQQQQPAHTNNSKSASAHTQLLELSAHILKQQHTQQTTVFEPSELNAITEELKFVKLAQACRWMFAINQLVQADTPQRTAVSAGAHTQQQQLQCVAFLASGVLEPLVSVLQQSRQCQLLVLCLQCLESCLRTLTQLCADSSVSAHTHNKDSNINNPLLYVHTRSRHILESLAKQLCTDIPAALMRVQDCEDMETVWAQASLLLPFLSVCAHTHTNPHTHNQQQTHTYLHADGALFSATAPVRAEALAVQLWLAFEDAYQMLMEVSELRKHVHALHQSSSGKKRLLQAQTNTNTNDGQVLVSPSECDDLVREAHAQMALSMLSLRVMMDTVLTEHDKGKVTLQTLSKCVRYTSGDPKKAIVRLQRGYTMWASQHNSLMLSDASDNAIGGTYDARHGLVLACMKALVESVSRIARTVASKEDKFIRSGASNGNNGDTMTDVELSFRVTFKCPYVLGSHPSKESQDFILENCLRPMFARMEAHCTYCERIGKYLISAEGSMNSKSNFFHRLVQTSAIFGFGYQNAKSQASFQKTKSQQAGADATTPTEIWRTGKSRRGGFLSNENCVFNWQVIDEERIKNRGIESAGGNNSGSRKRSRFTTAGDNDGNVSQQQLLPPPPPAVAPAAPIMMVAPTLQLAPSLGSMPMAPQLAPPLSGFPPGPDQQSAYGGGPGGYIGGAPDSFQGMRAPAFGGGGRGGRGGREGGGRGRGRYGSSDGFGGHQQPSYHQQQSSYRGSY
jgi:hypothetical protein